MAADTTAVRTPEDAVNAALVRIGYKKRLGNMYDGSDASQKAIEIYAQARDDFLVEFDWDFASRQISLTLLKSAPVGGYFPPTNWDPATNPPPGFLFEYAFPDDCLKVRSVRRQPMFMMNVDPQFDPFEDSNDGAYTPARRVIVCNTPDAIANYTGRITALASWEIDAIDGLIASLARRLAASLATLDVVKLEALDEASARNMAVQAQR